MMFVINFLLFVSVIRTVFWRTYCFRQIDYVSAVLGHSECLMVVHEYYTRDFRCPTAATLVKYCLPVPTVNLLCSLVCVAVKRLVGGPVRSNLRTTRNSILALYTSDSICNNHILKNGHL